MAWTCLDVKSAFSPSAHSLDSAVYKVRVQNIFYCFFWRFYCRVLKFLNKLLWTLMINFLAGSFWNLKISSIYWAEVCDISYDEFSFSTYDLQNDPKYADYWFLRKEHFLLWKKFEVKFVWKVKSPYVSFFVCEII